MEAQNKQHHIKALFSSFLKNGHSSWFDPQTKMLEPHCITKQKAPHEKYCSVAFQRMVTLHGLIHRLES